MPIRVSCVCGQIYDLPENLAGKKAKCQSCRVVFDVPNLELSPNQPQQYPLQQPNYQQQAGVPQQFAETQQPHYPAQQQPGTAGELPASGLQPNQAPMVDGNLPDSNPLSGNQYGATAPQYGMGAVNQQVGASLPNGPNPNGKTSSTKLPLIIGGAVAGVLVLVLGGIFFFWKGNDDGQSGTQNNTASKSTTENPVGKPLGSLLRFAKLDPAPKRYAASLDGSVFGFVNLDGTSKQSSLIRNESLERESLQSDRELIAIGDITNDGKFVFHQRANGCNIFSVDAGEPIWSSKSHQCKFSADSKFAMVYDDGYQMCLRLEDKKRMFEQGKQLTDFRNRVWSDDLRYAYLHRGQTIKRFDVTTGSDSVIEQIPFGYNTNGRGWFSHGATFFATANASKISVYDLKKESWIAEIGFESAGEIRKIELLNNGKLAVAQTVSSGAIIPQTLTLIDVVSQKLLGATTFDDEINDFRLNQRSPTLSLLIPSSSDQKNGIHTWAIDCSKTLFDYTYSSTRFGDARSPKTGSSDQLTKGKKTGPQNSNAGINGNSVASNLGKPSGNTPSKNSDKSKTNQPVIEKDVDKTLDDDGSKIPDELRSSPFAELADWTGCHNKNSTHFSFNNFGQKIFFSSYSGNTIHYWEREKHQVFRVGGIGICKLLCTSVDGNLIVVVESFFSSDSDKLIVWDVKEQKRLFSKPVERYGQRGAFVSPDSRFLAFYVGDNASILDVKTGEEKIRLDFPVGQILGFDSSSETIIGVDSKNKELFTFNIDTKKKVKSLKLPSMNKYANFGAAPNGRVIFGQGSKIKLIDYRNNKVIDELGLPPDHIVSDLQISKDGQTAAAIISIERESRRLILNLADDQLRAYDFFATSSDYYVSGLTALGKSKEFLGKIGTKDGSEKAYFAVWKVDFSKAKSVGRSSANNSGEAKLSDNGKADGATLIKTSPEMESLGKSLFVSGNGGIALVHAFDNLISRWDVSKNELSVMNKSKKRLTVKKLRSDGRLFFSSFENSVWDSASRKVIRKLDPEGLLAIDPGVYFEKDNQTLKLGYGSKIYYWNLKTNKIVKTVPINGLKQFESLIDIKFCKSVNRTIGFTLDDEYCIIDASPKIVKKQKWKKENEDYAAVKAVAANNAFFVKHTVLEEGSNRFRTKLFQVNVDNGSEKLIVEFDNADLSSVSLNADGTKAIISTKPSNRYTKTVVIDLENKPTTIATLPLSVTKATFAPDNGFIAAICNDKRIRIWRLDP